MKPWSKNNAIVILIMIPMAALYSFSLDLYIPLLPKAQEYFHSSIIYLQMGNSMFMLGFGIGQLVFGPVSDVFGRRPVIICSLMLYIVATLIIVMTESINVFVFARMMQSIGACGSYLCCFATIRDLYSCPKESAEMFSYLFTFIATSATFAPTIGTMLGENHSWKIVFVALLILGVATIALSFLKYAETFPKPNKKAALQFKVVYNNYKRIFYDINYHIYTFAAAIGIGSFFAFYCISPYLYQKTLNLTTMNFSVLYSSCGVAFIIGGYICGKTIRRLGIFKSLMVGLLIHISGCLLIIGSHFYLGSTHILPTHSGVILIIFGSSFLAGAGIGGTMAPFKDIAGSAFGMIGAYKFIFAELLGTGVVALYSENALSFGITLLALNIIAILLMVSYKNKLKES